MRVSVDVRDLQHTSADLLVIPLPKQTTGAWKLGGRLDSLDRAWGQPIATALASGDFVGRKGQTALLYPPSDSPTRRILLVGLGEEGALDLQALRRAGGIAIRQAATRRSTSVAVAVPRWRGIQPAAGAAALVEGAVLGGYRFDRYQAARDDAPKSVKTLRLVYERLPNRVAVRNAAQQAATLAGAQNLARDLSNEPANELPPEALAQAAKKMARATGLSCKVMNVAELERRKMGGILAVGQGSANTPRLIVLEHGKAATGAKRKRHPTICLVGKGITFDSGGISIKPAAGMEEMKHDMSGAAAVVGAMQAVAMLKIPFHVVGVIAAAENMPSGTAYRPGDIISSLAGKTIEILNTDAEGRVVLADALEYARTTFEPDAMIDLATLTGACMIALGPWATGVFSNHDRLSARMQAAGDACGERAWPMPLLQEHKDAMRSTVADLKNSGGRFAGASTAAGFLAAFVGDTPWVHLDIAGTGWSAEASPIQPKGATGVGVRLLLELLRGWKARPPV